MYLTEKKLPVVCLIYKKSTYEQITTKKHNAFNNWRECKQLSMLINTLCTKLTVREHSTLWPEMTDIINIQIRWEFAYHVEMGFICDY